MSSFVRQPVFHPVSMVFLDDNEAFLDGLRGNLRGVDRNTFFTKPQAALNFISSRDCATPRARMAGPDYSEVEKGNSNALGPDALDDDTRFDEIAAVVVDYEMPEIDGIRFLSSITETNCTKILLTGAAGDREAVEAFNAGLIDLYLKKGDAGMPRKLSSALAEAKRKHFDLRGHIGIRGVGADYCDPRVVRLLDEFVIRDGLVEYYWRPEQNVVLMFDDAGNPSIFVAWSADEWGMQCDVVAESGGPDWLRRGMETRRIMPLFWPSPVYRAGPVEIRTAEPIPVPEWDGAFYSLARIDATELESQPLTFAKWRQRRFDAS